MMKAFIFGLTIAIAIGPIAVLIINRGLNAGLRSGVLSGVGAALADFTYGIFAFTIGTVVVGFLSMNQQYFEYTTAIVLCLFGLWMLKGSIKTSSVSQHKEQKADNANYLLSTYLLTIVNPLTIILFLGFSGQLVSQETGVIEVVALAAAIFAGSLMVQLLLACFGATLGRFIHNPRVIRLLNISSSIVIILFGVSGLV